MGIKVRCATCRKETKRKCDVKKVTISPNKSRVCKFYTHDESKVKTTEILPSRPATIDEIGKTKPHSPKVRSKSVTESSMTENQTADVLSRFRSSATKGE